MRCPDFESRMQAILDERRQPERDEVLVRHARECDACHRLLAGQADLIAGLGQSCPPALSSHFATSVVAKVEARCVERLDAGKSGNSAWIKFVALAASIAALVLVVVVIGQSMRNSLAKPSIASQDDLPTGNRVGTDGAPASKSSAALPAVAKAIAPPKIEPDYTEYREAIHSLAAQLPSAVEKIDEVQQSTPAIRPLRASFSMAIGTLQKTIPNRAVKREPRPAGPEGSFLWQLREVVV